MKDFISRRRFIESLPFIPIALNNIGCGKTSVGYEMGDRELTFGFSKMVDRDDRLKEWIRNPLSNPVLKDTNRLVRVKGHDLMARLFEKGDYPINPDYQIISSKEMPEDVVLYRILLQQSNYLPRETLVLRDRYSLLNIDEGLIFAYEWMDVLMNEAFRWDTSTGEKSTVRFRPGIQPQICIGTYRDFVRDNRIDESLEVINKVLRGFFDHLEKFRIASIDHYRRETDKEIYDEGGVVRGGNVLLELNDLVEKPETKIWTEGGYIKSARVRVPISACFKEDTWTRLCQKLLCAFGARDLEGYTGPISLNPKETVLHPNAEVSISDIDFLVLAWVYARDKNASPDKDVMVPNIYTIPLTGDFSRQGIVDVTSFTDIAIPYRYGKDHWLYEEKKDFNGNGVIDLEDIALVLGNFGRRRECFDYHNEPLTPRELTSEELNLIQLRKTDPAMFVESLLRTGLKYNSGLAYNTLFKKEGSL